MRKRNIIKNLLIASVLALNTTSCADWLDVKMSDSIMENTLYSTNNGFLIGLNGVYLGLTELYSRNLATGVIDVMAQYYNVTQDKDHAYKIYAGYKFAESSFETMSAGVWTSAYELIANINTLLDHCDEPGTALRSNYYPLVKGEALALRAMLHFDMLRLYGPIYREDTKRQLTIPYQDISAKKILPLLPAEDVLNRVIQDLEAAAELLKEGDPIITKGVQNAVPSDDGLDRFDFSYRQLRLNYYAVKGLLARVYLWKQDKQKAYDIVRHDILDKIKTDKLEVFPWVKESDISDLKKADRIFSSEVMFSIYNDKRSNLFLSLFAKELDLNQRLTFVGTGLASSDSKVVTFYDDDNDWRKTCMWEAVSAEKEPDKEDPEPETRADDEEEKEVETSLYFTKFMDLDSKEANVDGSETWRNMIPLIRLSEMYLIAAECTSSDSEALEYINTIREHRNCQSVTSNEGDIRSLITKEFAREVIGEGQLYFYYKRNAMQEIISGTSATAPYKMELGNYVWPMPKVEIDKRGVVQ